MVRDDHIFLHSTFWGPILVRKNAPLLITAIICLSTFHLVHQYAVHITEGPSLISKRFKNIAHVFTQDFFVAILSRVFHRSLN
jgi:hypothetical protein